jgi:uncharacterized protein (TIGR02444 family)
VRLWDWALAAYGREGVAPACLHLQDHHGANVPLLLAAAWAAAEDRLFDVSAAVKVTRDFEHDVIGLLRAVRRGLKSARQGFQDSARELLRGHVKAAELEAERLLLDALEALAGSPSQATDISEGLSTTAAAWAKAGGFSPPPPSEIKNLARLIG